jgi:hypothetical protein
MRVEVAKDPGPLRWWMRSVCSVRLQVMELLVARTTAYAWAWEEAPARARIGGGPG